MNRSHYYAVKPTGYEPKYCRIEKAAMPRDAVRLAFGKVYGQWDKNRYQYVDLGTTVAIMRSDRKRIALLSDPNNWHNVE